MARAHIYKIFQNADGSVLTGATVRVIDVGDTDPLPDSLYTTDAGSSTLSNPFVSDDGKVEFYLDNPQRIRLGVTPVGGSEFFVVTDAEPRGDLVVVATVPNLSLGTPVVGFVPQVNSSGQIEWVDPATLGMEGGAPDVAIYSDDRTVGSSDVIPDFSLATEPVSAGTSITLDTGSNSKLDIVAGTYSVVMQTTWQPASVDANKGTFRNVTVTSTTAGIQATDQRAPAGGVVPDINTVGFTWTFETDDVLQFFAQHDATEDLDVACLVFVQRIDTPVSSGGSVVHSFDVAADPSGINTALVAGVNTGIVIPAGSVLLPYLTINLSIPAGWDGDTPTLGIGASQAEAVVNATTTSNNTFFSLNGDDNVPIGVGTVVYLQNAVNGPVTWYFSDATTLWLALAVQSTGGDPGSTTGTAKLLVAYIPPAA